ncbi:MAG TPA: ABC transporter ATP-binding protein [Acidimicrobiales bacterium]|jgi:ABC-2 type transport system ATP-binding protein|nr:ABC transporter ATP-binding protein [Acidimicrobiales bacterium]
MNESALHLPAIETSGLGKRYGSVWGLQDCSLAIPQGHVTALVGPNGAGKTTLLRMLAGLSTPTVGDAVVLGQSPVQDEEFLSSIGYLAQDIPLYKRLTAEQHLEIGAGMNRQWDAEGARGRLEALRIPTDRPVSTLSGGQRAQVALGLALAKRPRVLLLDEPVAALDPLARREFLASLTAAVAEGGLSVLLSSHLLHDLERVCDHLVLLAASRTQICDDIDHVLETHRMLVGPRRTVSDVGGGLHVVKATQTANQTRLLVRTDGPILDPSWQVDEVGLEDIVLAYMAQEEHEGAAHLASVGAAS